MPTRGQISMVDIKREYRSLSRVTYQSFLLIPRSASVVNDGNLTEVFDYESLVSTKGEGPLLIPSKKKFVINIPVGSAQNLQ